MKSIQIMADILSLCRQPQTKTQLMSKTSLSSRMLHVYLSQLQSKRLLEVHHSSTKYATTPEGFEFSERYAEVLEL
jgi:predicted transcriptional regulator